MQCCLALRLAISRTRWHSRSQLAVLADTPPRNPPGAKSHPIAMCVDEMAVVEGRFSQGPVRGRLQGDLSGVGPAQETAGAPRGPAGGPCAVNWSRVRSASVRENSRGRRTGLSRGQQYRRPSPHVLPLGSCDLGLHVLSNSQVPRTELYIGPKLRGSRASRALCKSKALHNASQTTAQLTSTAQHTATTS